MLQGTGSGPAGACPTRECGWVSAFSFIKALQEDQFEYPEELRSLDGPSWWALAQRVQKNQQGSVPEEGRKSKFGGNISVPQTSWADQFEYPGIPDQMVDTQFTLK